MEKAHTSDLTAHLKVLEQKEADSSIILDRYYISKLNKDQVNNLNRPVTCKEIRAVIKSLKNKKSPGTDGFSAEFYQNIKEELILILLKVFHIIETEEALPNSFFKVTVTLMLKPHKDSTKDDN